MPSNFDIHFTSIQKLFSNHGIKNITMDDIAHYLHVSKKTIYKQYSCKNELVSDIYLADYYQFNAMLKSLELKKSDVISKTIQLCGIVIGKTAGMKNFVLSDLQLYYADLHNEITDLYRESVQKTYSGILNDGKVHQIFKDEINPIPVARIFTHFFKWYASAQTSGSKEEDTLNWEDVLDYHFRSICNPVGLLKWEEFKKHNSINKLISMI